MHAVRWGAVALWAAAIFALSSVPGSRIPGHYGPVGHFGEYAILAVLLVRALGASEAPRPTALHAILLASAYGITDELHQWFVPLRVPDTGDWLLDTAGAVAGVLSYALARRLMLARQGKA